MSQTLQEKNKALLLEGFDVLFNKRGWTPIFGGVDRHFPSERSALSACLGNRR
jgi:hypothetical protein